MSHSVRGGGGGGGGGGEGQMSFVNRDPTYVLNIGLLHFPLLCDPFYTTAFKSYIDWTKKSCNMIGGSLAFKECFEKQT